MCTRCFALASVYVTSDMQAAASEAWESGGVGAYECYIAADDEELTAAEVYGGDEDEGNQLLSVPPVRMATLICLRHCASSPQGMCVAAGAQIWFDCVPMCVRGA